MEYANEYTSKAVGNAGLATGIIGTALGVLNGGTNLLGMGGSAVPGHNFVTKDELNYVQELARKDSEIALLKSEQNTEIKIADVYERVMTRVNADAKAQAEVNAAQAVYNASSTSAVAVLQNQVAQLQSMTQLYIPSQFVTPEPMNRFNSWTAPTT